MIHTPQIEKAIRRASILHRHQERKATVDLPYITHLFSVALIIAGHTTDEDTIIAGLLHDTLEDTEYTETELEKEFGARVKDIVCGVTEVREVSINASSEEKYLIWKRTKERYIAHLEEVSDASTLVSYADKIHNLQSIVNDFKEHGEKIWRHFKTSPKEQLWFFSEVFRVYEKKLDTELVLAYRLLYNEAESLFLH